MLRRCPALLAATAAALVLAAQTAPARAAGITYSITNNSGGPLSDVAFTVAPSGALSSNASPVNILAGSSGFSGDGKPLEVDLGTSSDPNTQVDGLVFNFVGTKPNFSSQPFQPGGVLNFSLNTSHGFGGTPSLTLVDPPSGVAFQVIQPTVSGSQGNGNGNGGVGNGNGNGNGNHGGTNNTPEPLSVVLWSVLAGAGLMRARKLRHAARG